MRSPVKVVSKRQFSRGRKRLNLPKDKRTSFIKSMGGWYKNYEAKNDISFEMSEAGQLKFVNVTSVTPLNLKFEIANANLVPIWPV